MDKYELLDGIYKECRMRQALMGTSKKVVIIYHIKHAYLFSDEKKIIFNKGAGFANMWRGYELLIDNTSDDIKVRVVDKDVRW